MDRRVQFAGIVVALAVIAAGCFGPAGLSDLDRSAINAQMNRWVAAFETLDASGLDRMLADSITIVEPGGTHQVTRQQFIDQAEASFVLTDEVHEVAFTNRVISGDSSMATVKGTWILDSTVLGFRDRTVQEQEWRFRKINGEWRVDRIEAM